jgi:small ligand-binding sensory domain FIST
MGGLVRVLRRQDDYCLQRDGQVFCNGGIGRRLDSLSVVGEVQALCWGCPRHFHVLGRAIEEIGDDISDRGLNSCTIIAVNKILELHLLTATPIGGF